MKDKQQKILDEANNQDIMKEYLIHGACLRCTKGMLNQNKADDETTITLNKYSAEAENKRLYTILDVKENPMSLKDNLWYATVKDTIKGQNIIPFRCNCVEKPNRLSEIERIKDNIDDCKENGVCKNLMNLNEEWDNMELSDGDQYLIKKNIKENTYTAGVGQMLGGINPEIEDAEGITMTSILFCKHGGLIYPVTSGQDESMGMVFALPCTAYGEHAGSLTWEQMRMNAEFIFKYLSNKGWSTKAICGLMGNIYKECKMNPAAWQKWEDTTMGYGLVQWTAARDKYLDYAGLDFNSANNIALNNPQWLMNSQLEFFLDTLSAEWMTLGTDKYYNKLALSNGNSGKLTSEEFTTSNYTSKDLALIFHACYERSGDGRNELEIRAAAAEKWYEYFSESNSEISLSDFPD